MKNKLLKMLKIVEIIDRLNKDKKYYKSQVDKFSLHYPHMAQWYDKLIRNRNRSIEYLENKLQTLKTEL